MATTTCETLTVADPCSGIHCLPGYKAVRTGDIRSCRVAGRRRTQHLPDGNVVGDRRRGLHGDDCRFALGDALSSSSEGDARRSASPSDEDGDDEVDLSQNHSQIEWNWASLCVMLYRKEFIHELLIQIEHKYFNTLIRYIIAHLDS